MYIQGSGLDEIGATSVKMGLRCRVNDIEIDVAVLCPCFA